MSSEWLTPADVARDLQVSVRTVGRWIDRDGLPALRVGSVVRISRQALAEWQRRHETAASNGQIAGQEHAPAPSAASKRLVSPLPFGPLPDGYTPVFGGLTATAAASPAARRSGSARQKRRPA